jgi:hypothetical protein
MCAHNDTRLTIQKNKKSTCVFAAQVLAGADRGEEKTKARAADCDTFCK